VKLAATLVVAACSAAPPPAPLLTSTRVAPPAPPDASPGAIATSEACLRDADATDVSLLEGDARTIDVCFEGSTCMEIDRQTSAITAWTQSGKHTRARTGHAAAPLTIKPIDSDLIRVCTGDQCTATAGSLRDKLASATSGDVEYQHEGVVAVVPDHLHGTQQVVIAHARLKSLIEFPAKACVDAMWVGDLILATSADCDATSGFAFLITEDDRRIALGDGRPLDTTGAFGVTGARVPAVLFPRLYTLVLTDSLVEHQAMVDLVPIQAESTPDPKFAATELPDGNWLVASATGGVGIVDHTTTTLTHTWIIPRCEAATGP
jgi:hypothetical protein